ncbi:hypothetical protein RZN05_07055 [Sphingomonas sp. HF-S4]|uniref:Uncharacterized protein n=1 Tax=Sphingomonas agrestis TaxID=3080540 RepID=A0ABU3Y5R2_9SPHN|nr:hypothetical protein [Sphingomonas sp. HF-S4]MDV3456738.1 hypothetical protein [Sphingomonas sp. HF-S4]
MTGFAITMLFGATFVAAAWTLYASIRPQLHRFTELFGSVVELPALPPRFGRVTVRAVPARLPTRKQLRAAA